MGKIGGLKIDWMRENISFCTRFITQSAQKVSCVCIDRIAALSIDVCSFERAISYVMEFEFQAMMNQIKLY